MADFGILTAREERLAIEIASGKTVPFAIFIQEAIADNGFTILAVEPHHAERIITLPSHHKDPFDRLQ